MIVYDTWVQRQAYRTIDHGEPRFGFRSSADTGRVRSRMRRDKNKR